MSERDLSHMDEIKLLTYADGELNLTDAAAAEEHLASCIECRMRLTQLRSDLDHLITRHRERKMAAARAVRSWADLTPEFDRLDGYKVRTRFTSPIPLRAWIGMAAAVAIAAVIWNFSTAPTINAAQLLEQASDRHITSEPSRRIAIRTRRHAFVRPARLDGSIGQRPATLDPSSELRILFEQANFSWEDPLSARSFARWRDQLTAKQDHVSMIEPANGSADKLYRIRTTTSHGVLSDAALTMRVSDLRPLHETLQFRNSEIIEINEAAPADPISPVQPDKPESRIASQPEEIRGTPVSAAEELRVLAALNEVGADLGDPVEVIRDDARGRLTITGVGIAPARQQQIRAAIGDIPGVVVDFTQPPPVEPGVSPEPPVPVTAPRRSALHDQLEARLGAGDQVEQFVDTLLADSEAALSRAHAVRKLAARFPPGAERILSSPERKVLHDLRDRHIKALLSTSLSIENRLTSLIGTPEAVPVTPCSGWQECSTSVLLASQNLDRVLNAALTGMEVGTLKAALGRWRQQIAALERSSGGAAQ